MSQSPTDEKETSEYALAWESLRQIVTEEGASLSGRESNYVYLNLGDGTFADVSGVSAADCIGDGRALALTDWDDDGRIDLVLRNRTAPRLQVFRNQDAGSSHFLAIELDGGPRNRDAIGARVIVEAGGRTLRQMLHAGEGFMAQSSKRLHFGLGAAGRVERVRVRWPDGLEEEFVDLAVDTRYSIERGRPEPRVIPARPAAALAGVGPSPAEKDPRGQARLALLEKLPLEPLGIPRLDGSARTVKDVSGGPLLLNLWSTTCASCMRELAEFREHAGDIRAAGLRIVTLCTDGEGELARARELMAQHGFAADAGRADEAFLTFLQVLFRNVVGSDQETSLPCSLLLDRAGQLVAIYFGRVEVDELLGDVAKMQTMDPADLDDTRLVVGRRLAPRKRPLGKLQRELEQIGRADLAEYFRAVARRRD